MPQLSMTRSVSLHMRRRRRASGPFLFGLLGCLLLLVRGAEGGAAASRKRLPDKVVPGEEGNGDADSAKKGSVDDVLNKAKEYLAAQESVPLTIPSAGDLLRRWGRRRRRQQRIRKPSSIIHNAYVACLGRYRELAFQGTGFTAGSALYDLATFHLVRERRAGQAGMQLEQGGEARRAVWWWNRTAVWPWA